MILDFMKKHKNIVFLVNFVLLCVTIIVTVAEGKFEPIFVCLFIAGMVLLGGGIVRAGVAMTTSLTTIDVVIDSSKAAEVLSQSGISSEAQNNDKLGQILNDAKLGHETKGRTKQWNKTGGIDDANDDFDSLVHRM